MSYELFWVSGSPNSWRTMLALDIKGIAYTSRRLDPSKGELKSDELLALNPRGKVPTLKDGDFAIHESIAIMAYLEKKHPETPLFGTSDQETGRIWQRIFEFMNHVNTAIASGVVMPLYRWGENSSADDLKKGAETAHAELKWLETILGGSDYLAGDKLSAADLTALPTIVSLKRIGAKEVAVSHDLKLDNLSGNYPNVAAWLGRLEALPAYDKAYPPHWKAA